MLNKSQRRLVLQPVDFTTLTCLAKYVSAGTSAYRTGVSARSLYNCAGVTHAQSAGWLDISWHPQAARLYRRSTTSGTRYVYLQPTTATSGLALVACNPIAPWERVVDLQFARRPGKPPSGICTSKSWANTATSSSQTAK